MATTSAGGITIRLDLYGSTENRGVVTNRRDRAIRRSLVKGLPASTEDGDPSGDSHTLQKRAADEIILAVGLNHHTIDNLQLQEIRTRNWGQTKVWVDLVYFRDFRTLHGPGGNEAFAYTRTKSGLIEVFRYTTSQSDGTGEPDFDSHGLPAGPMYGNSPDRINNQSRWPESYMWRRSATQIVIPTVLSSHPYAAAGVANLVGLVNSDNVSIGAVDFAPFTLKFETADVNVRTSGFGNNLSIVYETQYVFTALVKGHFRQMPAWNPNSTPNQWTTIEAVEFDALPFFGVFPIGN